MITVHLMNNGKPLCKFSDKFPMDWPNGTRSMGLGFYREFENVLKFNRGSEMLCESCKKVAKELTKGL